jgi:hypothetical protein
VVNELKELMRENVASAPPDHLDLDALVVAGRRRVRVRRSALLGGVSLVAVGAVVATAVGLGGGSAPRATADTPPAPDAPTIRLSDATQAVEGRDYRELTSLTNHNLNQNNGQYFDGITDDGLVLFRDGPRDGQSFPRFALVDPIAGTKDWLPDLGIGWTQTWPVQLGTDRLVLMGTDQQTQRLAAYVFDRSTRQWTTTEWPGLPGIGRPRSVVGPDGRLYVFVPATQGQPPPGGWPTGPDGEADDSNAEGDTFELWSVSLTDGSDIHDEGMTVGDLVFTDSSMVWTDRTGGDPGRVHVRSLATGDEHSFDPHAGAKCNLLGFGATDDRVVMGEYCGTYAGGVRDDRVQILSTSGDQVVTLQGDGLDGWLPRGSLVSITVFEGRGSGTYLYDLDTDRFLRISEGFSRYTSGDTGPDDMFIWATPENHAKGETERVGQLLSQ